MMRRLLCVFFAVLVSACAETSTSGLCSLDGEKAVSEKIAAWVHDHPKDIMESVQAYQMEQRTKQQAAAQEKARLGIAENHDALYSDPSDPVVGTGNVTVVEFFDAECPYCKRIAPDLARLIAENRDVRIVFKEYPILGPGSVVAAKAALAALKQGKYDAFHTALMADQTPEHQLAEPRIMEIAKAVGLNVVGLKADMQDPAIEAKINKNIALAQALGVRGTPGLIIGDQLSPGALPYPALAQAVANARNGDHEHP